MSRRRGRLADGGPRSSEGGNMTRCGQRRRRLLRGSPATQSEAEAATAEGQRYGRAGSETAAGGSRCSQAEVSMTAAQFEGCARQLLGDAGPAAHRSSTATSGEAAHAREARQTEATAGENHLTEATHRHRQAATAAHRWPAEVARGPGGSAAAHRGWADLAAGPLAGDRNGGSRPGQNRPGASGREQRDGEPAESMPEPIIAAAQ